MIRKFTFVSLAILVFISSGLGVSQSFAKAWLTDFGEIDAYISTKMKELGIPGAALVIVQGDQIVHLRAFAVADAAGRPVIPRTPFFTGSTGKSFTALAVMQLVEAGKIELDAPIQTYLPWFRIADTQASEMITVRQLLNQTRGLSGVPHKDLPSSEISTRRNATRKDEDQDNFFKPLRAKAGSKLELIPTCLQMLEYQAPDCVGRSRRA
jgi:CubicO group peptidase (beta-lactamase class C family)